VVLPTAHIRPRPVTTTLLGELRPNYFPPFEFLAM